MRVPWAWAGLVLLSAGSWWVTEEAADGRGLILSAGWCLAACLYFFSGSAGSGERSAVRGSGVFWCDVGLLLLLLGHVISGWFVFQQQGDRRAAVNLTLEWCGLLGAWWVVSRQSVSGRGAALLLELLAAIAVGQACLGVAQHHLIYAENAEWYRERREILDGWSSGASAGDRGAVSYARVQEILAEFRELQIPLSGAGRLLWENRVLYSQEPIGTFALANTLAGVLTGGLLILVARLLGRLRAVGSGPALAGWICAVVPILICGYCLVLTKSRSAWLGCVAGGGVLLLGGFGVWRLPVLLRRATAVWVAGLCGLLLGGVVLSWNGSLDSAVLAEAPRSLQFRLMYWAGTLRMLRERPLTGAGPGNFRESYMPWKSDASSEEIRDPHNLLLDAWSSSGVLGLGGLLLFLSAVVWRSRCAGAGGAGAGSGGGDDIWLWQRTSGVVWRVLLLAFVLDAGWEWLSLESLDEKWLDVLLPGGAVFWLWRGMQPGPLDRLGGLSALCGVCVHLLAAGGFEMPSVMLVVLSCGACAGGGCVRSARDSEAVAATGACAAGVGMVAKRAVAGWWWRAVAGVSFLVLSLVIVWQGVLPSVRLKGLLGAAELQSGPGGTVLALRLLDEAERIDSWAIRPRQLRVEILAGQLLSACGGAAGTGGDAAVILEPRVRSEIQQLLENCEAACERLIEADIRSPAGYLYRGRCRAAAGRVLADLPLQQRACEDYVEVLRRYRGKAVLWAEAAELWWSVGEVSRAAQAAGRALALQRVNERWGHQEQLLEPAVLTRLGQLSLPVSNGL